MDTHEYATKSPLLMASMSSSVSLMISSRRPFSSSSSVAFESEDSFTCEPSPFFAIIDLPGKARVGGGRWGLAMKTQRPADTDGFGCDDEVG